MRKLGTMTKEELHELLEKNDQFKAEVYEWIYERMMDLQREEFELMGADVFDYHDHYSSFYLSVPNHYGVIDGASVAHKLTADYLNEDARKTYEKLNELVDKWEDMTTDEQESNEGIKIEGDIDGYAELLAQQITDQLRAYENWGEDEIDYELGQIADGLHYASNWETDGTTIYEHITKEYK